MLRQDLAWGRTWPDHRKRLFYHPNWICPAGSSKGKVQELRVTATLPTLSQPQSLYCRYGCPICPTLRFAEGPVRLRIHKAARFKRSEYQSGVAVASLLWKSLSFMGRYSIIALIWVLPILHHPLSLSFVGWVSPLRVRWRFDLY